MNTKFLSFFRFLLFAGFFMQITVTQAQLDNTLDKMFIDSTHVDTITLSQFKKMSTRELDILFEQNAKELLAKFRAGKSISRIGLIAIGPGIVVTTAGVVLISCFDHYRLRSFGILGTAKVITWEYLGGIFLTMIGGVATAASTTFIIVGTHLKNQSKKSYINKYFNNKNPYQSTLKVGCTSNGIGLTLDF